MATEISYEKEQMEAIDGFDTSRAAVYKGEDRRKREDERRKHRKIDVMATYLNEDEILRKGCGDDCPWMGLFHVEMDAADLSEFLSDIPRHLIPALKRALEEADVEKDYDFHRTIDNMQIHLWSAPAPPLKKESHEDAAGLGAPAPAAPAGGSTGGTPLTTCGALDRLTICLMLAVSNQPMLVGPIWCKPPTGAL